MAAADLEAARALIERARESAENVTYWSANAVTGSDRDALQQNTDVLLAALPKLFALAEDGLRVAGATEAWAVIYGKYGDPLAGQGDIYPDRFQAESQVESGDSVRRVLILPPEPGEGERT